MINRAEPHQRRTRPRRRATTSAAAHYTKMFFVPGELLMLNEWNTEFRQTYMDGRPLPEDPHPIYSGYSIGKWEGDTFVIITKGFRDDQWLDTPGMPITDAATMTERITRPNFGTLNIAVTIDDPKAYTKPFTVDVSMHVMIDTQMIEEFCLENERDSARLFAPSAAK